MAYTLVAKFKGPFKQGIIFPIYEGIKLVHYVCSKHVAHILGKHDTCILHEYVARSTVMQQSDG